MVEPEERKKIYNFLKAHPVAVIATVDENNEPHASTLYIGVDDKLTITFTTKVDTQKYKHIQRNNAVMLVSYDAHDQAMVQIKGKAIKTSDGEKQQEIYQSTLHAAEQTGPDNVPPIAKISAGAWAGFTVEIESIWLTEYGHGNSYKNALHNAQDKQTHEDPA